MAGTESIRDVIAFPKTDDGAVPDDRRAVAGAGRAAGRSARAGARQARSEAARDARDPPCDAGRRRALCVLGRAHVRRHVRAPVSGRRPAALPADSYSVERTPHTSPIRRVRAVAGRGRWRSGRLRDRRRPRVAASPTSRPGDGELKRMYVLPAAAERRLGRRLFHAAFDWLEQDGPRRCGSASGRRTSAPSASMRATASRKRASTNSRSGACAIGNSSCVQPAPHEPCRQGVSSCCMACGCRARRCTGSHRSCRRPASTPRSLPTTASPTARIPRCRAWSKCSARRPSDIVAHSLGGLIALQALCDAPHCRWAGSCAWARRSTGSGAATGMLRWPPAAAMLGRSAALLQHGLPCWEGRAEVGVIAGCVAAWPGGVFGRFDGDHDGTVAIDETRLPGLSRPRRGRGQPQRPAVFVRRRRPGRRVPAHGRFRPDWHPGRARGVFRLAARGAAPPAASKIRCFQRDSQDVPMGRGPSIEGRKNAEDAKRGKIFTKIIREISSRRAPAAASRRTIRACARGSTRRCRRTCPRT